MGKIANYFATLGLASSLFVGCNADPSLVFVYRNHASGHDVVIDKYASYTKVRVGSYDSSGNSTRVFWDDEFLVGVDIGNDGTIDKISRFTKNGSSLEKLATRDAIQSIYNSVVHN